MKDREIYSEIYSLRISNEIEDWKLKELEDRVDHIQKMTETILAHLGIVMLTNQYGIKEV